MIGPESRRVLETRLTEIGREAEGLRVDLAVAEQRVEDIQEALSSLAVEAFDLRRTLAPSPDQVAQWLDDREAAGI